MRWIVALAAVFSLLVLGAPDARAAISLTSLDVSPSTTQAGAHPDLSVAAGLGGDTVRDVELTLPPGLVGNPTATDAVCTTAQFEASSCPAASKVGEAQSTALSAGFIPATAEGDVFNIQPRGDEPARLGLDLDAKILDVIPAFTRIPLEAPITVRPSDAALVTTIQGVPNRALGLPLKVTGLTMTLDGTAPSGRPFLTNPTACTSAPSRMVVTDHGGASAARDDGFTPTGCGAVPFTPSMSAAFTSSTARTPTGATVTLDVPAAETPIRQSTVRSARVVLPEGVAMNAPVGAGLEGCADAVAPACPAASDVGDARVETALVGALTGDVFLGTPTPADPYRLIVVLARPGLKLVLRGSVQLDPRTGRITTSFADLPQVPFTGFALTFRGGDRAVLRQSDRCGTQTAAATLTPWSGTAPKETSATFAVTDCAPALTPGLGVGASTRQAGASPALSITVERPARQPDIASLDLALPPGLLGRLASVPLGAQVGTVDVLAGAGGAPLALSGTIALVPGVGDELAALLVRVPAKVGPFDLGTVELRSGMRLRPDGGLAVSARDLPSSVGGIPLEIRRMTLRLDRQGFLVNPTQCGTPAVAAAVNGVAASAPYPVTGCERLRFAPKLRATIAGDRRSARKNGRPGLTTVITQGDGEAAIRSAAVALPKALAANIAAVGAACKEADPAACPASATVGSAEAVTPLLAEPLRGPVVLVATPGSVLPKLAVLLRGQIPLRLDADIALKDDRTVATFGALPDVPVTRFALTLDGMSIAASDLCGDAQLFSGSFTSWAGGTAAAGARGLVEGCGKAPSVTVTPGARSTLVVRAARAKGGPALRGLTVSLPAELRGPKGAKLTTKRRGASVRVRFTKVRPTRALRRRLAKGRRPVLKFTVDVRTSDGDTWTFVRTARARR
jgi:hypothetical protein